MAEAGVVPSVGSRGDSYNNALAESFNGLYKAELMRHRGPWRGLDDVEDATLAYVDWFNHGRLHGELGMRPPAKFEALQANQTIPALLAASQRFESPGNPGRFTFRLAVVGEVAHYTPDPTPPAKSCGTPLGCDRVAGADS